LADANRDSVTLPDALALNLAAQFLAPDGPVGNPFPIRILAKRHVTNAAYDDRGPAGFNGQSFAGTARGHDVLLRDQRG
jgi:hypothetical protein